VARTGPIRCHLTPTVVMLLTHRGARTQCLSTWRFFSVTAPSASIQLHTSFRRASSAS